MKAMADPPTTSLAWAWVLEALSQVKEVDLETLHALLNAVPDLEETLKVWKFAEERLALRLLGDGIAVNPTDDSGGPSEIELPLDSVSDVDAIEVLEKVKTSGSLAKCGSELKQAISQFIIKKKATLPKCAMQKLQDSVTKECNLSAPSGKEIFIVDSSCNIDAAQGLKGNGKNGEVQPLQQNSASVICKTGNEALQKHLHELPTNGAAETTHEVQPQHKSVDKVNDGATEATHEVQPQHKSVDKVNNGATEATHEVQPQHKSVDKVNDGPTEATHEVQLQHNSADKVNAGAMEATHEVQLQHNSVDKVNAGAMEATHEVQLQHNSVDKVNAGAMEATHEVQHNDISGGDAQDGAVETNGYADEAPLTQNLDEVVAGAEHVMVPETSSSSDAEHQTISDDERLGKGMSRRSLNVLNNDSLALDWTADNYCVKCEAGGELLICSNSSCLLAVHESCLGSSVIFEDDGSYYCPFCSYTRAFAAYRKAKQKVSMTWRAMTAFSAEYPLHQKKHKQPTAEFPSRPVEARHMRNSSPSKVAEDSPISKRHSCGREKDARELMDSDTPGPSMQNVDEATMGNQTGMKLSPERDIRRQRPVKRYASPLYPYGRRKKLQWTVEEEDALKDGVSRYSRSNGENTPWTKILEDGRHIFHKTRTPVDLKDKWRNIRKRQQI